MFYKVLLTILLCVMPSFASFDFSKLQSFQGKFTQTVTNESAKQVAYSGNVFIKNNGKVLWQYKKPIIKNVYIIDGIAIIDEPELEQAIYTSLDKEINIIKLLQKAVKINEESYKTKLYDIEYFIKIKDNKINSLKYEDELQNKVEIKFSQVSQDKDIDDELFRFLAPDYYDIIKK